MPLFLTAVFAPSTTLSLNIGRLDSAEDCRSLTFGIDDGISTTLKYDFSNGWRNGGSFQGKLKKLPNLDVDCDLRYNVVSSDLFGGQFAFQPNPSARYVGKIDRSRTREEGDNINVEFEMPHKQGSAKFNFESDYEYKNGAVKFEKDSAKLLDVWWKKMDAFQGKLCYLPGCPYSAKMHVKDGKSKFEIKTPFPGYEKIDVRLDYKYNPGRATYAVASLNLPNGKVYTIKLKLDKPRSTLQIETPIPGFEKITAQLATDFSSYANMELVLGGGKKFVIKLKHTSPKTEVEVQTPIPGYEKFKFELESDFASYGISSLELADGNKITLNGDKSGFTITTPFKGYENMSFNFNSASKKATFNKGGKQILEAILDDYTALINLNSNTIDMDLKISPQHSTLKIGHPSFLATEVDIKSNLEEFLNAAQVPFHMKAKFGDNFGAEIKHEGGSGTNIIFKYGSKLKFEFNADPTNLKSSLTFDGMLLFDFQGQHSDKHYTLDANIPATGIRSIKFDLILDGVDRKITVSLDDQPKFKSVSSTTEHDYKLDFEVIGLLQQKLEISNLEQKFTMTSKGNVKRTFNSMTFEVDKTQKQVTFNGRLSDMFGKNYELALIAIGKTDFKIRLGDGNKDWIRIENTFDDTFVNVLVDFMGENLIKLNGRKDSHEISGYINNVETALKMKDDYSLRITGENLKNDAIFKNLPYIFGDSFDLQIDQNGQIFKFNLKPSPGTGIIVDFETEPASVSGSLTMISHFMSYFKSVELNIDVSGPTGGVEFNVNDVSEKFLSSAPTTVYRRNFFDDLMCLIARKVRGI